MAKDVALVVACGCAMVAATVAGSTYETWMAAAVVWIAASLMFAR